MIPLKERMKIDRQPMPEQAPEARIKNFNEVPVGYSEDTAVQEANRCIECKDKPCVGGCPVNIDIPAFIKLIADRDFAGSIKKLKETNMLPAICGRVCPQEEQCEIVCVRGKKGKPVAIGHLERFAADWERANGKMQVPDKAAATGKKVAIVGSGPAGLTVAGDLAKLGHKVTVFEALHKAGGVLVYGIPEFRLPKAIIASEVDILQKLGVDFQMNAIVGKTDTIDELFAEGYDAVFVGSGAGLPWFMDIPGENLNGVYSANEFLTRSNLMWAFKFPNYDTPIRRAKNVAVVGGGNVAMDSARTAKRLGAENVYLIYRRTIEEMPARKEEVHHAQEEGIIFKYLTNPIKYIGNEKGDIVAVECLANKLGEPDASGRPRPVQIEGSNFIIDIDTCIVAIGNGTNPLLVQTTPGIEANKKGHIVADKETGKTSKKGVWAGGDIIRGGATVILAMGDGRKAASSMHEYLTTGKW